MREVTAVCKKIPDTFFHFLFILVSARGASYEAVYEAKLLLT